MYQKKKLRNGYAYVRNEADLRGLDGLVFDVDGVLVDSSNSYDLAVCKTYEYLSKRLFGTVRVGKDALKKTLYRLRDSGGFNCDWDSLYVMLLFTFERMPTRYKKDFLRLDFEGLDPYKRIKLTSMLGNVELDIPEGDLLEFVEKADSRGLDSLMDLLGDRYIKRFEEFLNYKSGVWQGVIPYVFDEIYYGKELFEEQHHVRPRLRFKGLIRFERLLVEEETLRRLSRFKLGLLTGRSRVGTYYSLGALVTYFDGKAQAFSEDDPHFKKPNPNPLAFCAKRLKVNKVMYVGDSMEDLLMAEGTKALGLKILFAGVYKGKGYRSKRLGLFMNKGADLLIPDVSSLPDLLEGL